MIHGHAYDTISEKWYGKSKPVVKPLKAPYNKLMWDIKRDETKILKWAANRWPTEDDIENWIRRIFDYAYAFAWEEPKTFFVRDRDIPGHGWVCMWKTIEGKRVGVPLDYVKRPWEKT